MCLPLSAPREAKEGSKTVRLVGDKSKQCPRWATRGSVEQVTAHPDICARRAVPRNRSVSGRGGVHAVVRLLVDDQKHHKDQLRENRMTRECTNENVDNAE